MKRSCVDLVDELWTLELDEGDKKKCAYSILQATKSICGLDALQYGIMSMLNDFPISSNEFSLLKQRYREEPKLFPHPFSTSLKKTPVVDRKEREREQALFIQLQELTRQDELYDEVYYHDK